MFRNVLNSIIDYCWVNTVDKLFHDTDQEKNVNVVILKAGQAIWFEIKILPEAVSSFSCLQLRWDQRRVFPELLEQR